MQEIYIEEYQERYALIIGINNYKSANNLQYAENDAKEIAKILEEKYHYKKENITLLLNEEATKQNIMDAYYKYIEETCNNDSLIVYYAGHGTTTTSHNGPTGFLIPYDGNEVNWYSLIRWDEFSRVADMIKAKHIFFVMDACYSGLAITRTSTFGSKRFLKDMLKRYSRQVLTAGKGDETVSDGNGPLPDHSIFTGFFIEALNGKAKTDLGIITANSIMSYVYNKVSNNTYSRQTPHYGFIAGDGDFIFDFGKIPLNEEKEKDNDFLIEVPTPLELNIINSRTKTEQELKELLSDTKNEIKINEVVNQELRNVLAGISPDKFSLDSLNEETFKERVNNYENIIENLMIMMILLTNYGGSKYVKLIKKVLNRITPTGSYSGLVSAISLLYYPALILYYCVIITALEVENFDLLKEILNIENDKIRVRNQDTKNILINISDNMSEISSDFNVFYPDKNYKYPMNEYLFKYLQPKLDDLLFLGDDYEQRFIDAEMLISVQYAINDYQEYSSAWGPMGRFNYKLDYNKHDIEKLNINNIINTLGMYNSLGENKEDFIKKYNSLLSKHYF